MPTPTNETLPVEGGELPITVIRSEVQGPAVVIVPSIFGVGADLVEQMQELAEDAPWVAAMDPFFRTQPGPLPYDDPSRAFERMEASDTDAAYRDFRALVDHARGQGNGKALGLGICFGGPFCLLAAADGALDGVVTWHGSRLERYLARAADIRCPLRLHFGDSDPITPPEAIDKIAAAFEHHDDVDIVVHRGATHGYSHRHALVHDRAAEQAGLTAARGLARELA